MQHKRCLPTGLLFVSLALACTGAVTESEHTDRIDVLPIDQPIELGAVRWERDYAAARARAARTDRDLLMLFQEVPG